MCQLVTTTATADVARHKLFYSLNHLVWSKCQRLAALDGRVKLSAINEGSSIMAVDTIAQKREDIIGSFIVDLHN